MEPQYHLFVKFPLLCGTIVIQVRNKTQWMSTLSDDHLFMFASQYKVYFFIISTIAHLFSTDTDATLCSRIQQLIMETGLLRRYSREMSVVDSLGLLIVCFLMILPIIDCRLSFFFLLHSSVTPSTHCLWMLHSQSITGNRHCQCVIHSVNRQHILSICHSVNRKHKGIVNLSFRMSTGKRQALSICH